MNVLTFEECHARSWNAVVMAKRAVIPEHRVMLEHMAEAWERICADMKKQETH
jgi:hypothetical protein